MADTMTNGWTILSRAQSGPNGSWTVTARRGSQALNITRLTKDEADSFDPQARWNGGR